MVYGGIVAERGTMMNETGTGILEMVLCLGIFMLLLAAAVPRYVPLDRLQLRYEALCLLNDLRYVQSCSHGMDYSSYENYDKKLLTPILVVEYGEHIISQQGRTMNWRRVEKGIRMYTNRSKFLFSPRGHATAGTVRLLKGGHEQRVVVDTVGRVRLEERQL